MDVSIILGCTDDPSYYGCTLLVFGQRKLNMSTIQQRGKDAYMKAHKHSFFKTLS